MLLALFFVSSISYGQQQLCSGSTSTYQVDQTENNGNGTTDSVYTWDVLQANFNGEIMLLNASGNQVQIFWDNTPEGNYTVEVTETNTSGCFSTQQLIVQIRNTPVVNFQDRLVCVDRETGEWLDEVVFTTGYNTSQYSFQWTKDDEPLSETGSFLTVSEAGNYAVTVTNLTTLCAQTTSANVVVAQPLTVSGTVGEPFDTVQYINIQVSGGIGPFEFSLNGNGFQPENTFAIDGNGLNIVTVRDVNGCDELQTLELFALGYPKFFTPNNDGFNDFWAINRLPNPTKAQIAVFDRYGKMIYQFRGNQPGWDGTLNGNEMPATDYWFTLSYIDSSGVPREFKAHFSLMR
uniref:T9SS type B sorting domain-containing protein n=1 Tax=Flavobacterium sp. TaxID=239 RepID=UPI00404A6E2B